jgi:hypothetical protein
MKQSTHIILGVTIAIIVSFWSLKLAAVAIVGTLLGVLKDHFKQKGN